MKVSPCLLCKHVIVAKRFILLCWLTSLNFELQLKKIYSHSLTILFIGVTYSLVFNCEFWHPCWPLKIQSELNTRKLQVCLFFLPSGRLDQCFSVLFPSGLQMVVLSFMIGFTKTGSVYHLNAAFCTMYPNLSFPFIAFLSGFLASLISSWLKVTPLIVLLVLMFVCMWVCVLQGSHWGDLLEINEQTGKNGEQWESTGVSDRRAFTFLMLPLSLFTIAQEVVLFYNYWCNVQMAVYEICMSTICNTKCSYIWLEEHIAFYLAYLRRVTCCISCVKQTDVGTQKQDVRN